MTLALQTFIDTYRPDAGAIKADEALIARYAEHLPASLLELWREAGFGTYANGLIQIINPDLYNAMLWGWLMRPEGEEDMTRIPIALSAFGTIFYYRLLSEDGDEDVSFIDPHTSRTGDLAWSLDEFFNDWCCDEENRAGLLEQPLLEQAIAAKGELARDQVYAFLPALRLGGSRTAESGRVGLVDASVHLHLLLDLALGG